MDIKNSKQLILINPRDAHFLMKILQKLTTGNSPPYSLLTLAALTPKEYKIRFINQKFFWQQRDFTAGALVGITCFTAGATEAYSIADNFRRAGSQVILGGPHVSALPEEALQHADSVVIGEAESVWASVIADFERGALQKTYKAEPLQDFFTPVYDYFLRMDSRRLRSIGILTDRGCKYHCDFCARISDWLRFVKIEQVIELIKRIKTAKRIFPKGGPRVTFLSDNIYSSPQYAKELFKALAPLNVVWGADASVDIGFDEEALQLAKASGCWGLLIGFETIHVGDYKKTSLAQLRSAEDYRSAIRNIRRHGIKIIGSFILGLDSYRHRDYLKLLWFLIRARLWFFNVCILTPFPGSALFARLKQENRIISFDWRRYNLLVSNIKPRHTSVFAVYFWFWLMRISSIYFTPILILALLICLAAWEGGYRAGRYLFQGY